MIKFKNKSAKVKFVSGLLAVSLLTSGSAMLIPTQSFASGCHSTGLIMEDRMPYFVAAAPYINDVILPSSVDWSYYYPIPGHQREQGSCVAFATGYAALTYKKACESDLNGHYNNVGYFENDKNVFSPAFIYNQIHNNDNPDGGGSCFSDAFSLLREQGCVTLAEMPYDGGQFNYTTLPNEAQRASAEKNKIFTWEEIWGSVYQMKVRIAEELPVLVGVPVYPDFDNLSEDNEVYDSIYGEDRGYHALCLVGYDDDKRAFKFINSWGTDWGVDGYGWVSYDIIREFDTIAYSFPVAPGGFRMTNASGLTIQFSWNRIADNKYAIYRRPTGSTEEYTKVMDTGTNSSVVLETPRGNYDYCVAIVDDHGYRLSGFSSVSTVRR